MILKHTLDFIFKGITVHLYYHMSCLAVNAKDSITKAKSYQHGQPQKRDPTAAYKLKIQPIVQNSLFHLPSLTQDTSDSCPRVLAALTKQEQELGREVKSLLSHLRPRFCNYSRGAAINY